VFREVPKTSGEFTLYSTKKNGPPFNIEMLQTPEASEVVSPTRLLSSVLKIITLQLPKVAPDESRLTPESVVFRKPFVERNDFEAKVGWLALFRVAPIFLPGMATIPPKPFRPLLMGI
jgi:hypothetical protein